MLKPYELYRGIRSPARWPGAIVPYQITGSFTTKDLANIQTAMSQFASTTCVRFVPHTTEKLYVSIDSGDTGCWSFQGRSTINKQNRVNLQTPYCTETFIVVHELMHALGFIHEFTRPDRDSWVSINMGALEPQYQTAEFYLRAFAIQSVAQDELHRIPYNYGSVMHYSKYGGAASYSTPVMTNLQPWDGDFGNTTGLSDLDIFRVNYRYCNSTITTATTSAAPIKFRRTTSNATAKSTKGNSTNTKPSN
ncbi:astacin-like [Topomyia yanbarensis]|uniref:astacin-like n=1 Tax=Topomyia yanbarensis TaxID=2498891 RepID=UPI00273B7A97|nr:astacin-like [Topomyia yanbarensis]